MPRTVKPARTPDRRVAALAPGEAASGEPGDPLATQGRAAYALVRERIIRLVYPPSAPLSENRLVKMLGIGPGPARYAIQRLASERLLNVVPRGRTIVAPIILSEVAQSFQIRTSLEMLAARIAARASPPEALIQMTAAVDTMREALAKEDREGSIDQQRRFLNLLVRAARHGKLIETLEPITATTDRFTYFIAAQFRSSMIQIEDYRALTEAIASADPDAAEKIVAGAVGSMRGRTMMDFLHRDLF